MLQQRARQMLRLVLPRQAHRSPKVGRRKRTRSWTSLRRRRSTSSSSRVSSEYVVLCRYCVSIGTHASVQKVASAWSRNNLPPKDLDLMFRSLESVYKANRSLLSVRTYACQLASSLILTAIQRLKEIGTNPSSPKALGDLLMRWVCQITIASDEQC